MPRRLPTRKAAGGYEAPRRCRRTIPRTQQWAAKTNQLMEESVKEVVKQFAALVPERPFTCKLTIRDGASSAYWTTPGPPSLRVDAGDRPGVRWSARWALVDELRTRKDERGLTASGMDLSFDQDGHFRMELQFPPLDFENLGEIPTENDGRLPRWVYLNLRPALIRQFDESQLNELVPSHVEQARALLGFASDVEYTKSISEAFYLLMLNINADGEILNGRFDQLFGRFAGAKPSLIMDIHRSWELFEDAGWAGLISEAVQLYSHFHPNVEVARQALGLSTVEKRTESDIMARYYAMKPTLRQLRAHYIREHVDEFTKVLVPRR